MFELFSVKKFLLVFLSITAMLVILKWGTDGCLPVHGANRLFPRVLPAPEVICRQMVRWEVWSLRSQPDISQTAASIVPKEENFSVELFGSDLIRLPLLLKRIPGESYPLIAIVVANLVLSAFFAILAQAIVFLVRPSMDLEGVPVKPRRLTATKRILETYRTSSGGFPLIHYRSLFSKLSKSTTEGTEQ